MTLRETLFKQITDKEVKPCSGKDQNRDSNLKDCEHDKKDNLEDESNEDVCKNKCSHDDLLFYYRVNDYFCKLAYLF